jgi:hypothetical protein
LGATPSKEGGELDMGPFCCASPTMESQRISVAKSSSKSTRASGIAYSGDFHESHDGAMEPDTSASNLWKEHNSVYMMGSADQSYDEQDEYNRYMAPMHARRRCLFATLLLCSVVATLAVALAAFRSYRAMVKFDARVFTLPEDASSSYPSSIPSDVPSAVPSLTPSQGPSSVPSNTPTVFPSAQPSQAPTVHQSYTPSITLSDLPSNRPSQALSTNPSKNPSKLPSSSPSSQSSDTPSRAATLAPTRGPTTSPTPLAPSSAPTSQLTMPPTSSR